MRIRIPYNVYAEIIGSIAHNLGAVSLTTRLTRNLFSNNLNAQVMTYTNLKYKASVLDYSCGIAYARILILENTMTRLTAIGRDSAFVYISGGIATVYDNTFSYSGHLSKKEMTNTASTFPRQYKHSRFPWEDYSAKETQDHGIFWFDFNDLEMPIKSSHDLQRNTFEHIYCATGCAYYVTGIKIQQFNFKSNRYYVMVSDGSGAAVFHGRVNLPPSNEQAQVWIQSYTYEHFEKIFGGVIDLQGNNVPITIVGNSKFINCFGI